jgi:hypothetical protein
VTADVRRFAAVLARADPPARAAADPAGHPATDPPAGQPMAIDPPAGVDPAALRLAMIEDTYEVLAGLELVTAALALAPGDQPEVEALAWPGTPILRVDAAPASGPAVLADALDACAAHGAHQAAVVAGDAPDLPRLLLGKLYRALGSAEVVACPAADGGLVAIAARLPAPAWLAAAGTGLDTPDAVSRLAAVAPSRRALALAPGWHRVRSAADLGRLDPGLEGWDATRALLAAAHR